MDARTYREQTQYDGYGRAGKTHDARGNMTSADSLRFYEYNALNQATEVRRVASVGSSDITIRARFAYGADGARYRRIDDGSSAGGTTTTTIIGAVERVQKPGGAIQWRRTVGGVAIVSYSGDQLVGGITQAAGAGTVRHQFTDRLGSVQVIGLVNGSSVTVQERLDGGADGQWRTPDPPFGQAGSSHTPRGFTGHEHLEGHDTIHMNGRLYWPTGGRMVQADPIITDIYNPQNWNPYSYVLNNPLNLTDPSGYSFLDRLLHPFKNVIRSVMRALGPDVSGALIGACSFVPGAWSIACAAGAGYDHARAFGASSSDARRSGVAGAFSAAVATIVKYRGSGLSTTSRVLIAATSGGITSVIQGGKFGHGFVSAGVTARASPYVSSNIAVGTATSAIIGGTVSEMTGGKFANGARSGAFAYVVGRTADSFGQSYHDEKIGFFGRLRRAFSSHPMELESSVIKDAMLSAWHDAQTGDPYLRHEEGGFWGYEPDGSYGVRRWPPGTRSEIIVPPLGDGNMFKGLWVQGDFHVHPSPRPIDEFGVRRHLAPSDGDLRQTKRFNLPGNSYVIDNVNVYWMNRSGSWDIVGRSEDVFR